MKKLLVLSIFVVGLLAVDISVSQKECFEQKNQDECVNVALSYLNGDNNLTIDVTKAISMLDSACSDGHAKACGALSDVYSNGSDFNITTDVKKAFGLAKKGCELDDGVACDILASMYRGDYDEDMLTLKNTKKVFETYKKACELKNNDSCDTLAHLYINGDGTKQDIKQGVNILKELCQAQPTDDYNPMQGCVSLGIIYYQNKSMQDISQAIKLFEQACQAKYYDGCVKLSSIYLQDNNVSDTNKTAMQKGLDLLSMSCDNGILQACATLSYLYTDSTTKAYDIQKGIAYAQKACDKDNLDGCFMLASIYLQETEYKNEAKAIELFKKLCDKEDGSSCTTVGDMYFQGVGTEQNLPIAMQYYTRACKLSDDSGCEAHDTLKKQLKQ